MEEVIQNGNGEMESNSNDSALQMQKEVRLICIKIILF